MGVYAEYCLPHLINCACGMKVVNRQREKVVPMAQGKVLEIGMGSGLNLRYYDPSQVEMVWGLEPSLGMRRKARSNLVKSKVTVDWLSAACEKIPLENASADTVVLTYALCTIPDWQLALSEIRRVLKPTGQLLFSEHGLSPEASVKKWQNAVNPYWKRLAGGCNINRPIATLIESEQFTIQSLDEGYLKGPKIATYQYMGVAV